MIIRPLTADDKEDWAALWAQYLAFYETTLPAETYDITFARLIGDDTQDYNALVAEENDRLVGLTHYLYHRHCWRIENVCYLQDLFTAPLIRGRGVGRQLIEAVYERASNANVQNVYWLTQDDNIAGRQLYDRIGTLTNFIKYQKPA